MSDITVTNNSLTEILAGITPITERRAQAKTALEKLGLPTSKNEEYRFTPIARVLGKNFDLTTYEKSSSALQQIKAFEIPELDAQVVVMVNGQFSRDLSNFSDSEIYIQELDENKHAEHLARHAEYQNDALVAWNTAAWSSGVFIHIPEKKVVSKPILIYHINDTTSGEVKSITRNLVVVGKHSEVTIVEKFDSIGTHANFSNLVTEVIVSENAGLNFYHVQADHGNRYQFTQTTIAQAKHSRVNCYTFTLDGKFVRNNLHLNLDGEGCESHMYGLYLLQGDTLADNHTVVDHRKPNSFSNELYKGILDGNSKGIFNGKIFVRPQAQKTNAFQSNRNILLSDKSTINTKPQLEIWADDVKCSHGCTTGQLDDEALFYLRSRGIEKNTARAMMLYAFAAEVVESIPNEKMKAFIDNLISERLHKNF